MHTWNSSVTFVEQKSRSWWLLPINPSHCGHQSLTSGPGSRPAACTNMFFLNFHFILPFTEERIRRGHAAPPPASWHHRGDCGHTLTLCIHWRRANLAGDKIYTGIIQWNKEKTMIIMFIFTHPNWAMSKTRRLWNQFETAAKPCNYYRRRRTEPHSTRNTETLRTICNSSPEK